MKTESTEPLVVVQHSSVGGAAILDNINEICKDYDLKAIIMMGAIITYIKEY